MCVWPPSLPGKGGHQEHRRSLSPAWPRPPQDTGHPSSGPVSHLLRRLALIPSSLGLGWNVVTGVRVLEGANPHSSLGRAGCLSLSGVKAGGPRPGSQEMASCHPLSTRLSVPPNQTAYHFSARDQDGDPFAHPGAEDLPQLRSGGWTPGSQGWQEKETDSRANRRETELGTLRQLRGG